MSGVGRGRGAVIPAWMKSQNDSKAPGSNPAATIPTPAAAPPSSAAQLAGPSPQTIGAKRPYEPYSNYPQHPLLPEGWFEAYDATYKRCYFYNPSTGERSWVKPEKKVKSSTIDESKWESAVDPGTGREYYFNRATQERVWELPAGAALKESERGARGGAAVSTTTSIASVPSNTQAAKPDELRRMQEGLEPGEVEEGDNEAAAEKERNDAEAARDEKEDLVHPSVLDSEATIPATEGSAGAAVAAACPDGNTALSAELQQLPAGWQSALDSASGLVYYYNESLQITQWEPPSAANAAPALAGSDMFQQQSAYPEQPYGGRGGGAGTLQRGGRGQGHGRGTTGQRNPKTTAYRHNNRAAVPASGGGGGALDPMDPSSYSDAPRGGWSKGLGNDAAM